MRRGSAARGQLIRQLPQLVGIDRPEALVDLQRDRQQQRHHGRLDDHVGQRQRLHDRVDPRVPDRMSAKIGAAPPVR